MKHRWPCAFCPCSRDSKHGIQMHEHIDHGQEAPPKNKRRADEEA